MRTRYLVLLMALAAVVLYAAVLPLWEGWDEPFHLGYIEALRSWNAIPVFGETPLSKEIEASLYLTPLPQFLSAGVPGTMTFAQQAALTRGEKLQRRRELDQIPTELQSAESAIPNYEAQQAPLAYLYLAPLDAALDHLPLVRRIFWLRLATSLAGIILTFFAVERLLVVFRVEGPLQEVALACILSTQVLWASFAHVSNDWLAIPCTIWFAVLIARAASEPSGRNLIAASLILAVGLLTKAYFLAFVPVLGVLIVQQALRKKVKAIEAASAVLITLLIGGVWYGRNIAIYHSLSGTQESIRGTPLWEVLFAFVSINWLKSLLALFRSTLWCGNWSFTPFPKGLLNIEIILLMAGLLLFAFRRETKGTGIRWVAAVFTALSIALIYQTCAAWVDSDGALATTEPWYCQGILICVWAAVFAGLKGHRRLGFILATSLSCLTALIAAITFLRFLIPGYAGAIQRPTTSEAWDWWSGQPSADLALVSLVPPAIIYTLLAVYLCLLAAVTISTLWAIVPRRHVWRQS
jgi:hypothetical protein